jgi:hypothetical protein
VELNAAVIAKLVKHREDLVRAIELMRQAYEILLKTDDLRVVQWNEGHHVKARQNLLNDRDRLSWFVTHILNNVESDTSAYAGNTAAFLTPGHAERLKQEYREDKI